MPCEEYGTITLSAQGGWQQEQAPALSRGALPFCSCAADPRCTSWAPSLYPRHASHSCFVASLPRLAASLAREPHMAASQARQPIRSYQCYMSSHMTVSMASIRHAWPLGAPLLIHGKAQKRRLVVRMSSWQRTLPSIATYHNIRLQRRRGQLLPEDVSKTNDERISVPAAREPFGCGEPVSTPNRLSRD